jgi:hypothetical protein
MSSEERFSIALFGVGSFVLLAFVAFFLVADKI